MVKFWIMTAIIVILKMINIEKIIVLLIVIAIVIYINSDNHVCN